MFTAPLKKKKILTFHKFPLWPPLLLLPYQKFIKGISILSPMGPRGAIDLVGEKGYKYRIIHLRGGQGCGSSSKPPVLSPREFPPGPGSSGAGKWVKCVNSGIVTSDTPNDAPGPPPPGPAAPPKHHKLSKVSSSAKINRAALRSLSKSCSWPSKEHQGSDAQVSSLISKPQKPLGRFCSR